MGWWKRATSKVTGAAKTVVSDVVKPILKQANPNSDSIIGRTIGRVPVLGSVVMHGLDAGTASVRSLTDNPSETMKNPGKAVVAGIIAPIRSSTDYFGATKSRESKLAAEAADAAQAEADSKAASFAAATEDNILDEISRREILSLSGSGANAQKIAAMLASARQGKGIYAVRKTNEDVLNQQKSMPGRRQTMGSGYIL